MDKTITLYVTTRSTKDKRLTIVIKPLLMDLENETLRHEQSKADEKEGKTAANWLKGNAPFSFVESLRCNLPNP